MLHVTKSDCNFDCAHCKKVQNSVSLAAQPVGEIEQSILADGESVTFSGHQVCKSGKMFNDAALENIAAEIAHRVEVGKDIDKRIF